MIHPNIRIQYINDTIGYGVFATRMIPKGSAVYVKDSLEIEIRNSDLKNHSPEMQTLIEKYSYMDERGIRVISWDLAKYVNHCCNANTLSTAYGFDIAVRDIQEGEELTCDYGMLNVSEEMPLVCNQVGCRKVLKPSDFETCAVEWEAKVKAAIQHFMEVEQPLLAFIEEDNFEALMEFFYDPAAYRSVRNLRFKEGVLI